MKKRSVGLSDIIYTEWLRPIMDYYRAIRKNEAMFEILIPVVISIACSVLYHRTGDVNKALDALAELLPTAISILIGFTVMLITLLLTSPETNIDRLKGQTLRKKMHEKQMTLYQGLLVQFCHLLFSEIILLIIVFFYVFLHGLNWDEKLNSVFLCIEVYFTLNILLSIIRGVANLYFSFYGNAEKESTSECKHDC